MEKEKEIAQWLNDRILRKQTFYQEDAVREISKIFGNEFTYVNGKSGGLRINRKVLEYFKTLKDKRIEYVSSEKYWYVKFEPGDTFTMPEFDPIGTFFDPQN